MAEFTIVGLDPELDLFAYCEAVDLAEVERMTRAMGCGGVIIFNGIVPTADGRRPQPLLQWAELHEPPVQQGFSINPKNPHQL